MIQLVKISTSRLIWLTTKHFWGHRAKKGGASGKRRASGQTHDDDLEAFRDVPNVRRIGRYELREEIGKGGFGNVYRAIQVQPVRRQVAI